MFLFLLSSFLDIYHFLFNIFFSSLQRRRLDCEEVTNKTHIFFNTSFMSLQIEVFLLVTIALLEQFSSLPKSKMFKKIENDL